MSLEKRAKKELKQLIGDIFKGDRQAHLFIETMHEYLKEKAKEIPEVKEILEEVEKMSFQECVEYVEKIFGIEK